MGDTLGEKTSVFTLESTARLEECYTLVILALLNMSFKPKECVSRLWFTWTSYFGSALSEDILEQI